MNTRKATIVLVLLTVLAGPAPAQTVIFVDANATGPTHDGSDWCHAYLEVYDALGTAGSDSVIRVADGTYLPDTGGLADAREATFQLGNGVTLEGGYAGCGGADPDERNVAVYATILSGDIGSAGVSTDNSYHVVTGSGTDESAVLDGFTVTAGYANGSSVHDSGGGMYNDPGSPTVSNCTFSENTATGDGAGMYNDSSSPKVINCTFSENLLANHNGHGVGMYTNDGSPTVICCTFRGNSTGGFNAYGGGMYNRGSTNSTLVVNCMFSGNTALSGAGAYVYSGSNSTFINCTFSGNSAFMGGGGGIRIVSSTTVVTMANCILWGNTAAYGGTQIDEESGPTVNVTHSCVEGGWPGTGNFDDDPMLVDADGPDDVFGTADDDVHLLDPDSPCIDAGDNSATPADTVDLDGDGDTTETVPIDLDGNARIRNHPCVADTGIGERRVVDVGVFEIQYPLRTDIDEDGDVDLADYVIFQQEFTGPQ